MPKAYLNNINKKETNPVLVSLRSYAEEFNVPVINEEGIKFINQVIKLKGIKTILEIGTAIGYSSINMALNNDVEITTIERDEGMFNIAKENIFDNNLENRITQIFNDALEVDESTLGSYDLIFIDAAKAQSIKFFDKYKKNLTKNGVIITDNLLFHELVVAEIRERNLKQLVAKIDRFNKFVVEQDDFDTYIYHLGDGMSLSIKKD
ncbi:Protein-L-isoaspartate O-methyltransferase [Candidatus Izimaplasma bacterium HR1]|uniref:O-methyltransferase n=1 Tax=Candidatus Izimoplasma sp. HR1 TaxID=1541959 RepID=UPI0004F5E8AA|nr:Protein-L-isoaspartate O-methyltransferase [Candidatus Izimaplasma bacterium HR1]